MNPTLAALEAEPLTFKIATQQGEFEQIHRLNYRTFVEEIPQHAANGDGALVDKFDRENVYFICRRGDRVIGMMAIRASRPFSLDGKLKNLDEYLPPNRAVCEIRLLAVEPDFRSGVVFRGLMKTLNDWSLIAGLDTAVISGTPRQAKLYKHIGFVPFGPIVGTAEAPYQPMYLTREAFAAIEHGSVLGDVAAGGNGKQRNGERRTANGELGTANGEPRLAPESFLPGPVNIHPEVWAAFNRQPVSHRHPDFAHDLQTTQRLLCGLVNAGRAQLLVGSGTLANDAIAAQLTLLGTPGVVLDNGEFGGRLVDHAQRAHLQHTVVRAEWGALFDYAEVERAIGALPRGGWCWMVHCETSSGILNDLAFVRDVCAARGVRLCVDCVSSVGTVPVDLAGVYLASCVSGKAIGGLPGLSMVFHHHHIAVTDRLPRYLDLGYYAEKRGVPFTHSSNLLAALRVAAERTVARAPFTDVAELARWMRARLVEFGFSIVAPEAYASPAVVSLAFANGAGSPFGDRIADAGFELSYRSEYLRSRDWVQIALMGECPRERVERLLAVIERQRPY